MNDTTLEWLIIQFIPCFFFAVVFLILGAIAWRKL